MNRRPIISSVCIISIFYASVTMADQTSTLFPDTQSPTRQTQALEAMTPSLTPLLQTLSRQVILPLYQDAEQAVTTLNKQVISLCNHPSIDQLQTTKLQWSTAMSAWSRSEVALFGPALKQQRDLHIYFRPVKKRVIKKLLSQDTAITIKDLTIAGVGAQGFASLEYLLFDRKQSDQWILKRFTGDDNRYCQHLLATSTLLKSHVSAIYREWKNNYAFTIETAGAPGNTEWRTKKQALELFFGKTDQLVETVSNKLRHALAKNAYKLEAWRSGHTLKNIQCNIQGIELILSQGGVLDYLRKSGNPQRAQQLKKQLAVIWSIHFVHDDLFTQIENKQLSAADQLFTEVQNLSHLIQQIASELGVQLGFNDSDGD